MKKEQKVSKMEFISELMVWIALIFLFVVNVLATIQLKQIGGW